ncbi:hypothetical protein BKA63DRAFT_439951 [Paraphoma chrysanthemicola]|nr:hypothetical protein BKA63DRAFT_439951 [Paraphoma chrysanthemicola]
MALTQPGTYVLYSDLDSVTSPWPAMVYVDEYAPQDVQSSRPSGYVTLVLLLGEPYRFRWATTCQLSSYVPAEERALTIRSRDLRQAYEAAEFMRATQLGLSYWQTVVDEHFTNNADPVRDSDPVGTEEELDDELKEALRISHEQYYRPSTSIRPAPSPPTRKRSDRRSSSVTLDNESDMELYEEPGMEAMGQPSPKRSRPSRMQDAGTVSPDRNLLSLSDGRTSLFSSNESSYVPVPKRSNIRQTQNGRSAIQDVLNGWGSLGQRSNGPTSDVVEGDLCESRDFVQLRVGQNLDVLTLQKKDVWDRPYFKDSRGGLNHFILNEENTYELRHPGLAEIDVVDFQFVAEYLTVGEFGIRFPDDKEQAKEAVAQCVSAWESAEKLTMGDMLEHIAEKVKYIEWDNEDVLTLAILVYGSSGARLPAHDAMRDWISSYLAHHFWVYIKDDAITNPFRKRLRRLRELERDVFEKRTKHLTAGVEDEDDESDEERINDEDL